MPLKTELNERRTKRICWSSGYDAALMPKDFFFWSNEARPHEKRRNKDEIRHYWAQCKRKDSEEEDHKRKKTQMVLASWEAQKSILGSAEVTSILGDQQADPQRNGKTRSLKMLASLWDSAKLLPGTKKIGESWLVWDVEQGIRLYGLRT